MCHSDLSVQNGTIPLPTPIVLGHEGAGVVEEVGEGVTDVAARRPRRAVVRAQLRDLLLLRPRPGLPLREERDGRPPAACSTARPASRLDGEPLLQMAMCGTFGNYAIVPEISLREDRRRRRPPLRRPHRVRRAHRRRRCAQHRQHPPGDSVAVVGCGGVGLNVIQGAKIAGAEKIIAVDMFESKLEMAEQFGATDVVKADEGDPVTNVMGLTGGRGADVAFEVIGLGPTIEQTINMIRHGGEAILVGVPRMDVMLNLNAAFTFLYMAKTVKGCWYGSSQRPRGRPEAARALEGRQAQARGAHLAARSASTASTRRSPPCSRARWPGASSPTTH